MSNCNSIYCWYSHDSVSMRSGFVLSVGSVLLMIFDKVIGNKERAMTLCFECSCGMMSPPFGGRRHILTVSSRVSLQAK